MCEYLHNSATPLNTALINMKKMPSVHSVTNRKYLATVNVRKHSLSGIVKKFA